MAKKIDSMDVKKRHVAARLWTAAKNFFGVKPKAGLFAAIEAKNTVGGTASHSESKELVGLIHPGGFVVMTPQRRNNETD